MTGSINVQGIYVEAGGWESGFVVCFYRSEKSEDTVRINQQKVRINTDKLNLSQKNCKIYIGKWKGYQ